MSKKKNRNDPPMAHNIVALMPKAGIDGHIRTAPAVPVLSRKFTARGDNGFAQGRNLYQWIFSENQRMQLL